MVSDILAYGRIGRGEIALEPVDLNGLVREIVALNPMLQEPSASVSVANLETVIGHEPSLHQAISNLLTNAVKFTGEGDKAEVKVWTETQGSHTTLFIEDGGIGIDPLHQNRLFGMFERIHPDLPYDGTGVGLAIVKRAVERMGGKVGVQSDGKSGSRFWISLPSQELTNV
jgi:signal transduction histidine kinase